MIKNTASVLFCSLLLPIAGCGSIGKLKGPDYEPVPPAMPEPRSSYNGGLFYEASNVYIFEGIKAAKVGDILTIVLSEKTNASKSASLDADKKATLDLKNPTLFGNDSITARGKLFLKNSANANRELEGEGKLKQQNSIAGKITVTVTEVLPNGYLVIRGEKLLTLNEGSEVVRISGIVRPADVDANNQVLSAKIANAKITYKGNGVVSNSSKAGWLTKFFMHAVWPL